MKSKIPLIIIIGLFAFGSLLAEEKRGPVTKCTKQDAWDLAINCLQSTHELRSPDMLARYLQYEISRYADSLVSGPYPTELEYSERGKVWTDIYQISVSVGCITRFSDTLHFCYTVEVWFEHECSQPPGWYVGAFVKKTEKLK